jgi:ABC-type branched-subunit amino acid transport system ATPase component
VSGAPLLRVRGLAKRYGGIIALDHVDLDVEAGELLGIIGPNGSGKSTLFDCVTGLVVADAGTVALRGEDVSGLAPHVLAARGLVRSFQKTAVFGSLSLLDNLVAAGQARAFGGTLPAFGLGHTAARRTAELAERARAFLDALDLASLARTPAAAVSFGQQKLLQFASCLMSRPDVVLLDEPLAGVNAVLIERMVAHIREATVEAGTTFVIVEHNTDVLLGLCARVVVLARGRVLAAGAPDAVARDARVVEAYLGVPEAHD